jgi:hypothetical protein
MGQPAARQAPKTSRRAEDCPPGKSAWMDRGASTPHPMFPEPMHFPTPCAINRLACRVPHLPTTEKAWIRGKAPERRRAGKQARQRLKWSVRESAGTPGVNTGGRQPESNRPGNDRRPQLGLKPSRTTGYECLPGERETRASLRRAEHPAVRAQQMQIAMEASIPNPIEEFEDLDRPLASEPGRIAERRRIDRAAARLA